MTTMVEKMARAMAEIEGGPAFYDRLARAALTALLEPSEGMASAGADHLFASSNDNWSLDAREVFTAMIQAALDEREG